MSRWRRWRERRAGFSAGDDASQAPSAAASATEGSPTEPAAGTGWAAGATWHTGGPGPDEAAEQPMADRPRDRGMPRWRPRFGGGGAGDRRGERADPVDATHNGVVDGDAFDLGELIVDARSEERPPWPRDAER